jgi:Mlc titration factor MtfA (ptsG expression regulator)
MNQVRTHVNPKDWTLQEVMDVELTLKRYAPLLKAQLQAGNQSITSVSRAQQKVVADDSGGIVNKPTVLGTTFHGQKNVTMFDRAITNPKDFATGRQQFRGTLAHEFAHGLVQHKPVDPSDAASPQIIDKFVTEMDYWDTMLVANYHGRAAATTAGKEAPISQYGSVNAKEDLADTMKFFFEDPQKLRDNCPQRFRFIYDNLKDSLDPTFIAETITPLKNW